MVESRCENRKFIYCINIFLKSPWQNRTDDIAELIITRSIIFAISMLFYTILERGMIS